MKAKKHISVVISNIAFLLPLLFTQNFFIWFVYIGLAFTSAMFHWYEYKWNGFIHNPNGIITQTWRNSIGFLWQKLDMIFIFLSFCTTIGYLVDAVIFGFVLGLITSILYYKYQYFNHYTIGLLIMINILIVSSLNLYFAFLIIIISGVGFLVRTEADINPTRHSLWHILQGIALGLIVSSTYFF